LTFVLKFNLILDAELPQRKPNDDRHLPLSSNDNYNSIPVANNTAYGESTFSALE
jgi:hypothetical protein